MRVVERASAAVEVGEEQVAVDQAVDRLAARDLLQRAQRLAGGRQQLAPSAPPHRGDRRFRSVALRTGSEVERRLPRRPALDAQRASHRERRPRARFDLDLGLAVGAERERDDARERGALEHDEIAGATHAMGVVEHARRAHAQLPVPERALQRELDLDRRRAAVLDRDGVDGAGEVGVAAVRREDGAADHQRADRAGEGRQPLHRALPGDPLGRELAQLAVDAQRGAQQRRPLPRHEVGIARELHGCSCTAVQHADGVQ